MIIRVVLTVYVSTASSSRCPTNYQTHIEQVWEWSRRFTYAMTGLGGNHVGKEEEVVENTLRTEAQRAEPDGRFTNGHECHQVHALIFCFFQQGVYPTRIAPHQTEGAKVPEGCCNHARNTGDCFEEDDSLAKVGTRRTC